MLNMITTYSTGGEIPIWAISLFRITKDGILLRDDYGPTREFFDWKRSLDEIGVAEEGTALVTRGG